jgi:mono/diheme cytochrome c family protein
MGWMRVFFVAALVAVTTCGCRGSGDEPGYVVTPGMVESVPWDPYDPNPVTKTGQTLMTPPRGTLPYGTMPYRYGTSREETARAGRELANPISATRADGETVLAEAATGTNLPRTGTAVVDDTAPPPAVLARGKWVYETYCLVCHGPGGEGDGPVIGVGRLPNPPSLLANHARDLADGAIYNIVTRGQGLMPSYAAQVTPIDRWRAVHYVRKLQSPAVRPGGLP